MTSDRARQAISRRVIALALIGTGLGVGQVQRAALAAQPAPAAQPPREVDAARLRDAVVVRSSADRSAIWIGDRFTFTVDIRCTRGTDILTDDLARDKLRIDELEVLGVDETREDRGDGVTVYRFTYHLTSYSLEPATKRIGEMGVRFYVRRPGQRPEDVVPAGDVLVPGAIVVVRSLLPDDRHTAKFRSERLPLPRAPAFAALQPIGVGLVVVSIVPAALWTVAVARRVRQRRPRESARHLRHDERALLDEVRALDVETETGRREAFDRLSALVRRHIAGTWGVPTDGLTPAELRSALSARDQGEASAPAIAFLETCERAKYGRPEDRPPGAACLAAIDLAEQLTGLGRS